MAEFFCTKYKMAKGAALVPSHQTDEDALKKLPVGRPLRVKVTRIRNVDHHRKYFALLNYAFDVWEPPKDQFGAAYAGAEPIEIEKNFDRFRKDIVILCGFYEAHWRVDGSMRIEPKSISFAKMDQDEFEQLYDKTVDVIIKHVLKNHTGEELRAVIEQVMEFDS